MRRALSGTMATFGENNPHVFIRLNNLGMLLHRVRCDEDDDGEAEALLLRACHGARKLLGAHHPHSQTYSRNLQQIRESRNGEKKF